MNASHIGVIDISSGDDDDEVIVVYSNIVVSSSDESESDTVVKQEVEEASSDESESVAVVKQEVEEPSSHDPPSTEPSPEPKKPRIDSSDGDEEPGEVGDEETDEEGVRWKIIGVVDEGLGVKVLKWKTLPSSLQHEKYDSSDSDSFEGTAHQPHQDDTETFIPPDDIETLIEPIVLQAYTAKYTQADQNAAPDLVPNANDLMRKMQIQYSVETVPLDFMHCFDKTNIVTRVWTAPIVFTSKHIAHIREILQLVDAGGDSDQPFGEEISFAEVGDEEFKNGTLWRVIEVVDNKVKWVEVVKTPPASPDGDTPNA
jgi:hypothetical protein